MNNTDVVLTLLDQSLLLAHCTGHEEIKTFRLVARSSVLDAFVSRKVHLLRCRFYLRLLWKSHVMSSYIFIMYFVIPLIIHIFVTLLPFPRSSTVTINEFKDPLLNTQITTWSSGMFHPRSHVTWESSNTSPILRFLHSK